MNEMAASELPVGGQIGVLSRFGVPFLQHLSEISRR